jgi:hypothetical protein
VPRIYDLGFSFFSFQRARRPTPETLTTRGLLVTIAAPRDSKQHTLEANTGNITLRLALATETGEEDLVVLVDKVQATIVGDCYNISACPSKPRVVASTASSSSRRFGIRTESSDLLAVLDELDPHALANSLYHRQLAACRPKVRNRIILPGTSTYGVGLLGFDADLLKDDALGVGRATEGAIHHC